MGGDMQKYTKSIMIRVAPSTYEQISHLTRIEDRTISNMARVLLNEALQRRDQQTNRRVDERRENR
jgi:hypothetical protein